MKRISSIDFTRGLVMIIMALDHTRDLMHLTSLSQSPTDLATTTPMLFFTRWITHLCAPTFVFLSGVSAWLSFKGKNDLAASRRFLLTRGLWLIILEFTLVNFGVWFDIHFSVLLFDVIATIGVGFIVLGLSLKASARTLGIAGLIIIFCHNLLPLIPFAEGSAIKGILSPLFALGAFPLGPHTTFLMAYPPIPWLGIMLAGFGAGQFFGWPAARRQRIFVKLGLGALALFVLIRAVNIYGDPFPWAAQKNGLYSFMSFINITKYPPSLIFCLLTLGITFLILALFEGAKNKFAAICAVYGKVPLFYFLVHWYIIHPIMFAMVFLQGFKSSDLLFGFNFGRPKEGSGVSLGIIYLVWIAVVIILYPICKWYGHFKETHKDQWWLRYL
ncbi:MAG TPA: heparan-alpha-glucosaminide N-acetyltransferase domain-containing protein [Puia sp.]|nr:heparan-alpha-glucosaminide N-acetyltransferase domain-containing protein [Puia sp.]